MFGVLGVVGGVFVAKQATRRHAQARLGERFGLHFGSPKLILFVLFFVCFLDAILLIINDFGVTF